MTLKEQYGVFILTILLISIFLCLNENRSSACMLLILTMATHIIVFISINNVEKTKHIGV